MLCISDSLVHTETMAAASLGVSIRRVERLVLGAPLALRAVSSLHVYSPPLKSFENIDKPIFKHFIERHLPQLRHSNPTVKYQFTELPENDGTVDPGRLELLFEDQDASVIVHPNE